MGHNLEIKNAKEITQAHFSSNQSENDNDPQKMNDRPFDTIGQRVGGVFIVRIPCEPCPGMREVDHRPGPDLCVRGLNVRVPEG